MNDVPFLHREMNATRDSSNESKISERNSVGEYYKGILISVCPWVVKSVSQSRRCGLFREDSKAYMRAPWRMKSCVSAEGALVTKQEKIGAEKVSLARDNIELSADIRGAT